MKNFLTTAAAVIVGLIVYDAILKRKTTADNFSMPYKGGTPRKQSIVTPYGNKGGTTSANRHK